MERPTPGTFVHVHFKTDTPDEEKTLAVLTAVDHEPDEFDVYGATAVTVDGNSTVAAVTVHQNEEDARDAYDPKVHAPTIAYLDETVPAPKKTRRTRRTAAQKAADDAKTAETAATP